MTTTTQVHPDTKKELEILDISEDDLHSTDKDEIGNFSFLEVCYNIPSFKYKLHHPDKLSKSLNFVTRNQTFSLVIYLLVENDHNHSSHKLRRSLDSIYASLRSLEKIGITNKNILICLYILHFYYEKTFLQLYPNLDYLSSCCVNDLSYNCGFLQCLSQNGIPIKVLCLNRNSATRVETQKCFFLNVLNDLFLQNIQIAPLNVVIYESGLIPSTKAIMKFIKYGKACEGGIIAVPSINSKPITIHGHIQQFDYCYQQIYNLHFADMTTSVKVDHRFHYMKLDNELFDVVKKYFISHINSDAGIAYHDNKMGVVLDWNGYDVYFIKEINVNYAECSASFNDVMIAYCENKEGALLVFFTLLVSLFTRAKKMNCLTIIKKTFLSFQIIEIVLEFIRPSLTILASYSILRETFSKEDDRLTTFFIIIYVIFLICSCFFSLISTKMSRNDRTFALLTVLFSLYYYLILICGIIAIHFIRINNINDKYQFNPIALSLLMGSNFIFIAIPLFIYIQKVIKNIKGFFLYTFIGYPSYFTSFCYHSFMFFLDQYGFDPRRIKGIEHKSAIMYERKKMFVLLFVLTNSVIGLLCFFLTNRTSRVIMIEVLGIVGAVFNGVRMIAIVVSVVRLYKKKRVLMKEEEWDEESTEIRGSILGGLFMPSEGIDLKPTIRSDGDTTRNIVKGGGGGSVERSFRKGITQMMDDSKRKTMSEMIGNTEGRRGSRSSRSRKGSDPLSIKTEGIDAMVNSSSNNIATSGNGMKRRKQKSSTVKKVVYDI